MCTHEPQCRPRVSGEIAGSWDSAEDREGEGQVTWDKFVPEHHLKLDRRLYTRAALGSHHDRYDR
jgi:hypothetical protein